MSNDWIVKLLAIAITSFVMMPFLWFGFMANNHNFIELGVVLFSVAIISSLAFVLESFIVSRRQNKQGD